MDISSLKDYIIENDLIPAVLEFIGCHSIKDKGSYVSAANPDGDNPTAITVYKDSLHAVNYTRDILGSKSSADLFDIVAYAKECNFFESLRYVCEAVGLSLYHDFSDELPESVQITQLLMSMIQTDQDKEEDVPLKPIPDTILGYYDRCVVAPFLSDGISADVQEEMQIGYDQLTNRITIPIRDVYGTLVGVKGRWFDTKVPEGINKYMYLERCNKGQILYGLYRAIPYIKRKRCCYVVESEKGVLQGMSMGINNIVASGGWNMSDCQIEMLSRLCVEIVLCFDQDIPQCKLEKLASRFIGDVTVSAMLDTLNILDEKESPTDNEEKFMRLKSECIITLRTGANNEV